MCSSWWDEPVKTGALSSSVAAEAALDLTAPSHSPWTSCLHIYLHDLMQCQRKHQYNNLSACLVTDIDIEPMHEQKHVYILTKSLEQLQSFSCFSFYISWVKQQKDLSITPSFVYWALFVGWENILISINWAVEEDSMTKRKKIQAVKWEFGDFHQLKSESFYDLKEKVYFLLTY